MGGFSVQTRRERILTYIKEHSSQVGQGFTTAELVVALDLVRSNVSKELNVLVREGLLVKSKGRPVRYQLQGQGKSPKKVVAPKQAEKQVGGQDVAQSDDVFEKIIGRKGSLKTQVEQAKAALLYPPHGLNVLITGPTGSGKTYFANAMYHFACSNGIIKAKQPFTTFNCADYAHNPQLLMSHLFGYVKGSFTGANEDKDGLIQEADGGMLFLDEVHRLPPEGQEMIFYFMDHGTYNRLGETAKNHHADVRIVCATTEDPESSLLSTFVRRIPITIQMPSFKQRTMRERLGLLRHLLIIEANRIQKNITLNENVVQALLGSVTYGNVGQLKSNIQLVCAQGFLNNMQNQTEIQITFDQLPPNIKDGLTLLANNRKELGELTQLLEPTMTIYPDNDTKVIDSTGGYELPYNLYEIIGDKAAVLKNEGLDQEAINNFILTDINVHLKTFYRGAKIAQAEDNLNEIVDQEIIDITKAIMKELTTNYDYALSSNFLYAMSLHISSFIKRVQLGRPLRAVSSDIVEMVKAYPLEQKMASRVKELLEEHYHFPVPESEVYYLAILLVSLKSSPASGQVGIIVAAHGKSTASSMVQVVEQLLSADNLRAFDMSLEMSPQTALAGIAQEVRELDRGNGVLLLVDMGSLSTFSERLTKETGVQVRSLDMVTTAMVLEAARKTTLIDRDLDAIYKELREFNGYSRQIEPPKKELSEKAHHLVLGDKRPKVIVAICSTGEGTAKRIKEMLDRILIDNLVDDILVEPISVVGMEEKIAQLQQKYRVIAATGITQPKLDVPFVSLENLLQGGGEQFIKVIENIDEPLFEKTASLEESDTLTEEMASQYLEQYYTFLNPVKVVKVLWDYCDYLDRRLDFEINNAMRISLIMHLGGAIERNLLNSSLTITKQEEAAAKADSKYELVVQANGIIAEALNIELSLAEVYYLIKLIDTQAANLWYRSVDTQKISVSTLFLNLFKVDIIGFSVDTQKLARILLYKRRRCLIRTDKFWER